ncbi:S8/S53 family peptidase (plasmid) [Rhizobium leguminosarum bv. trifolii]|nr:S8/S53 family peptidase [Rhizobium leguminosarum bv. trifolii]
MANLFAVSHACLLSALLTASASTPSFAEDLPAANVFIEFSGGGVDRDMAAVINAFSGKSQLLPVHKYMPAKTSSLCPILDSQLGLGKAYCTGEVIAAIRALNEKNSVTINPDAVNPVQGVVLPEIKLTETEISRVYNLEQKMEAQRLEQIEKNPSWQNSIVRKETDLLARSDKGDMSLPQLEQLTFKRIAWQFTISGSSDRIIEAQYLSQMLVNRNLSVDVESTSGFDKTAHSATRYSALDHYKKWCVDQNAPNAEGSFSDLAGWLYETKAAVACEGQDPPRPEVVIMDQAIDPNSDLAASFPGAHAATPQPATSCQTSAFTKSTDHGTLLSTIVASNANGYGFLGVEPRAMIRSFVWDQRLVTNNKLKVFIREAMTPVKPQVYLFASEFAPYTPHPDTNQATAAETLLAKEIWRRTPDGKWLDLLVNDQVRVREGLAREILQSPMLLVVSAGQAIDGDEGREIHWETPMPPQNLGDYDKVLVVAACENCDGDTAKLWKESNRGLDNKSFVGVMAPGGGEIPTYLSNHKVGETMGGTSASAAFAAGLAAKMASCYPSSYNAQPYQLKERIILASRPIAEETANEHVAGGVIDPEVSMLDPRKDWLKLKESPVRAVAFVKWCSDRLKLDDDTRDPLNLLPTRRISNVEGVGLVQQRVSLIETDPVYSKHQVRRELPATVLEPDKPIAVVRYDSSSAECAVNIPRLTDLFLSKTYADSGDCSAAPLCE